jgi:hypothetical protein
MQTVPSAVSNCVPTVLWAITGTYMNGPLAGPSAELSESELSTITAALAVCVVCSGCTPQQSQGNRCACLASGTEEHALADVREANMYG